MRTISKRLSVIFLSMFLVMIGAVFMMQNSYAEETNGNPLPEQYTQIEGLDGEDIICVDVTRYQQQKNDWNKTWKDYNGKTVDLFTFLKSQGVNTVAIKAAVNPTGENTYLSKDNALATAKAAKNAGLKVDLVLLYSDEMTWGNTQNMPADWVQDEQLDAGTAAWNVQQLANQYTTRVLTDFQEAGVTPDIVTIGNEVNYNFLGYTDGDPNVVEDDVAWRGWDALRLLSTTVKSFDENIKVAYSFAAPENADGIQWMISGDNLNNSWDEATYDYVGVNLYSNTHDTDYINGLIEAYNTHQDRDAKLIISGINYPYIDDNDPAIDLYTQMDDMYELLVLMAGQGGIVYTEGDYVGNYSSFFAVDGCAVPSLGVINCALTGSSDVKIDPYRYGGDFGMKEVKADIKPIKGMTDSTIKGVDISSYAALKEAGVIFYDNEGNEASLMTVLKDNGVNYVRIRIWNDPYNENGETYGGGSNDPEKGLEMAKEATDAGLRVELCIHYSDFWADPAQQILPKAWKDDASDQAKMEQNVYEYTKQILTQYKEAGVDIGMVQVGNEITNGAFGMMRGKASHADFWRDANKGKVICSYLNAGAKAVKEVCPDALVALHLDATTTANKKAVFNAWEEAKVDYDVLGISYYPFWGVKTKDSTPEAIKTLADMAAAKGKMFCVFETSWPTTLKDADGKTGSIGGAANVTAYNGAGIQNQVDELTDMYTALVNAPNGIGAFYWEPAWIPVKPGWAYWKYNLDMANEYGTGWCAKGAEGYFNPEKLHYQGEDSWGASTWENLALFDNNGYPLDSLRFYKDSVPEEAVGQVDHMVVVRAVSKGKYLGYGTVVKTVPGEKKPVTIPTVPGYKPASGSYKISVTGTEDELKRMEVEYTAVILKKGQKVKAGGATYQITKVGSDKTTGTVALVKAKNVKKSTVPAKVVMPDNRAYNVQTVHTKAFTGKKIRHAVIGASVTKIKKKAFKGSKVTKLTVTTKKLTKKGVKGSLKGSKVKKIYVKVGKKSENKKYVKKYKPYFKKKNSGKKVKVK